jgi:hypothetical protein
MKSLFADPEVSILAIADHRRRVTRLAAPEPEGAPLKRRWPLKITGEKVQTFTTERDKAGKIVRVVQLRPFPRGGDDEPQWRGVRFEGVILEDGVNIGLGLQVDAGTRLDVMASVALDLYNNRKMRIDLETRPTP